MRFFYFYFHWLCDENSIFTPSLFNIVPLFFSSMDEFILFMNI